MAVCGVCSVVIKDDEVKCSGKCNNVFHSNCVKGDGDGVSTRSLKTWKCKDCRHSSVSSKSAQSSTALTKDFLLRVLEDFKREIFGELKSFKAEMSEVSTSMQFLSDKVDASNALMSEIKKEMASVRKESEDLRVKNVALSKQVGELQERVRHLEQYSRKNNVEVSGIPTSPKENVKEIVRDLGVALGVEVQPSHIAAAHRIPSFNKTQTPSIVVQFHDRDVKESLLSKFKESRNRGAHLTADQVNKAFPRDRVYVNEHLSPENKQFLAKLKKKCREVGYMYVWCRDGKFFVRRAAGEKVERVSTMDDIEKLK